MILGDALGLVSETSPVDLQKGVFAVNGLIDSLIETLSNCQEQLQQLDGRCEPPQCSTILSHGDSPHSDEKILLMRRN